MTLCMINNLVWLQSQYFRYLLHDIICFHPLYWKLMDNATIECVLLTCASATWRMKGEAIRQIRRMKHARRTIFAGCTKVSDTRYRLVFFAPVGMKHLGWVLRPGDSCLYIQIVSRHYTNIVDNTCILSIIFGDYHLRPFHHWICQPLFLAWCCTPQSSEYHFSKPLTRTYTISFVCLYS